MYLNLHTFGELIMKNIFFTYHYYTKEERKKHHLSWVRGTIPQLVEVKGMLKPWQVENIPENEVIEELMDIHKGGTHVTGRTEEIYRKRQEVFN